MASKNDPTVRDVIELPLYVGMGEDADAQSRTNAAVVSENVSFNKDQSISTRRYMDKAPYEVSGTYRGVSHLGDQPYLVAGSSVVRVTPDAGTTIGELPPSLRNEDNFFRGPDLGFWHPQTLELNGVVITVWLQPSRDVAVDLPDNWDLYTATFTTEGELLTGPTLVEAVVSADYSLCKVSSTRACLVATRFATVLLRFLDFSGTGFTHTTGLNALYNLTSFVTQIEVFGAAYDIANAEFQCIAGSTRFNYATDTTDFGDAVHIRLDPAGALIAETVIDTKAAPTGKSVNAGVAVAYCESASTVWVACMDHRAARINAFIINAGVPTAANAIVNNGYTLVAMVDNNDAGQMAQTQCRGLATSMVWSFEGDNVFLAHQGYQSRQSDIKAPGGASTTGYQLQYRHHVGTGLTYLGDTHTAPIPAPSYTAWIPGASLLGDPCILASGNILCPVAFTDNWQLQAGTAGGYLPGGFLGDVWVPGSSNRRVVSATSCEIPSATAYVYPAFGPSYKVGALAQTDVFGEVTVHSFFGLDEVDNGSEETFDTTFAPGTVLAPHYRYGKNGASVITGSVGEEILLCFNGRLRRQASFPYDGTGSPTNLNRTGWRATACVTSFFLNEDAPLSFATTRNGVVVRSDGTYVVDNDEAVVRNVWPIPPDVGWPNNVDPATGAANDFQRAYKACWTWVDHEGYRHRGPMSHVQDIVFTQWTDERLYISVNNLPNIPGRDQYVLEVYGNPIDRTYAVVDDTFMLVHEQPANNTDDLLELVLGAGDTVPGVPFDYTTGGELPNEEIPNSTSTIRTKDRLWAITDTKAYFSKKFDTVSTVLFNTNLYVESPDGLPFTGITTLDEQTVLFTSQNIFVARGQGPNNLGTGQSYILQALQTPTGCLSPTSVVATESGVFFLGNGGIHVLLRNMSVMFVGDAIEDTTGDTIRFAVFDRGRKEVVFGLTTRTVVLDTESGLFTTADLARDPVLFCDWGTNGLVATTATEVLFEDDVAGEVTTSTDPRNESPPMKHSTPWIELASKQGYQRCREILIQGRTTIGEQWFPADDTDPQNVVPGYAIPEPSPFLTVLLFADHESDPYMTRTIDLRTVQRDPLEIRIHNPRQKCRSLRVELRTERSNINLTVTSIAAVVGRKKGADKRQTTQGT